MSLLWLVIGVALGWCLAVLHRKPEPEPVSPAAREDARLELANVLMQLMNEVRSGVHVAGASVGEYSPCGVGQFEVFVCHPVAWRCVVQPAIVRAGVLREGKPDA